MSDKKSGSDISEFPEMIIRMLKTLGVDDQKINPDIIRKILQEQEELDRRWKDYFVPVATEKTLKIEGPEAGLQKKYKLYSKREESLKRAILTMISLAKVAENIEYLPILEELKNHTLADYPDVDGINEITNQIKKSMITESSDKGIGTSGIDQPDGNSGKLFGFLSFKKNKLQQANIKESDVEKVKKAYISILDKLPMDDATSELKEKVGELRKKIAAAGDLDLIFSFFFQIISIVNEHIEDNNLNQKQLLKFLLDTIGKINTLQQEVMSSGVFEKECIEKDKEFTTQFETDINAIDQIIQTSDNIKSLKSMVAKKLTQIRRTLTKKRKNSEENISKLNKKLALYSSCIVKLKDINEKVQKKNQTLQKKMMTDPITKIFTRAMFNRQLEISFKNFLNDKKTFSLIIITIPDLPTIYESKGYIIGDKCIIAIVNNINQMKSENHFIARLGETEFALVLPETDITAASQLSATIKSKIENMQFITEKKPFNIKIFTGSAEISPTDESPNFLYKRAKNSIN